MTITHMTFDPLSIPALKPGEYERLLQKHQADLGLTTQLPPLLPIKLTKFGRKASLASSAVKAEHWEDLPGWADWDHLRVWHVKRWPFESDAPRIIKGNEEWAEDAVKIRKDDLDVLSYAWIVSQYEHNQRYGKYSLNPRWAGILLELVAAHDLGLAAQLEAQFKKMRITVERT